MIAVQIPRVTRQFCGGYRWPVVNYAVWGMDSGGSKEQHVLDGVMLAPPGEYN